MVRTASLTMLLLLSLAAAASARTFSEGQAVRLPMTWGETRYTASFTLPYVRGRKVQLRVSGEQVRWSVQVGRSRFLGSCCSLGLSLAGQDAGSALDAWASQQRLMSGPDGQPLRGYPTVLGRGSGAGGTRWLRLREPDGQEQALVLADTLPCVDFSLRPGFCGLRFEANLLGAPAAAALARSVRLRVSKRAARR